MSIQMRRAMQCSATCHLFGVDRRSKPDAAVMTITDKGGCIVKVTCLNTRQMDLDTMPQLRDTYI